MRSNHRLPLLLVILAGACATVEDSTAPATPQLAVFSRGAGTTAEGTVELEVKANLDPGDRLTTPTRVKYGLDEKTEGYVEVSPFNYVQRTNRDDVIGFGDVRVGTRYRFLEDDGGNSAAGQVELKLPTGKTNGGISTGEFDLLAAAMFTHEVGEVGALGAYYEIGLLGDPDSSGLDIQQLLAFQGNYWFSERSGVFAELANFYGRNSIDPIYFDVGLARRFGPGTVLELGGVFGLNDDAADAAILLSITNNFGRLASGHDGDG